MVEPMERPASEASLTCPTTAVSIRMNAGSAMSWPNVGIAREIIERLIVALLVITHPPRDSGLLRLSTRGCGSFRPFVLRKESPCAVSDVTLAALVCGMVGR